MPHVRRRPEDDAPALHVPANIRLRTWYQARIRRSPERNEVDPEHHDAAKMKCETDDAERQAQRVREQRQREPGTFEDDRRQTSKSTDPR
mmetsp:Transcript_44166/g.116932  ORF Transcript_44166/g.116932 Transcript_44166/m.116932 type:complete len:90 (-) Transcript_44166:736-1005(-)